MKKTFLILGTVASVMGCDMGTNHAGESPKYRADWFYMVTEGPNESRMINPFPLEADCKRFAEESHSKCFTGTQMADHATAHN